MMCHVPHNESTVEFDGTRRKHLLIVKVARMCALDRQRRHTPRIRLEDDVEPPAGRRLPIIHGRFAPGHSVKSARDIIGESYLAALPAAVERICTFPSSRIISRVAISG